MERPPLLRDILANREPDDAEHIYVSYQKSSMEDIYRGPISECPEDVLNLQIRGWLRHDGIYIV